MTNALTHYATFFKNWAVKTHGSKPTAEMFETAHNLGCAPGKQALALAMGLRPEGVTNTQVLYACDKPQSNKRGGLVTDGHLKLNPMPKVNNNKVYQYTVTPKGLKRIESAEKRAAALEAAGKAETAETAGKPKVKRVKNAKPRKPAKVAPATDPLDGLPVDMPVEPVTETASV